MPAYWARPPREPAELTAAAFDRTFDWRWRRTSYSDITAGTYDARVASEPEEGEEADVIDEPSTAAPPTTTTAADRGSMATPSLLAEMPVGVHVGTLIPRVLD